MGECKGSYGGIQSVNYFTTYTPREHSLVKVNYMTDHVLLQLCMSGLVLEDINCIIVDEAHEDNNTTSSANKTMISGSDEVGNHP